MKIKLLPDQQIWFTSDTHYAHSNICRATTNWKDADQLTRDFTSLEEMNQTLVERINQLVMPDDILIHLGDWSFGGFDNIRLFRQQLNCKNIILVLGNHDHHIARNKDNIQGLFKHVTEYLNLEIVYNNISKKAKSTRIQFVCMHYPIASWDNMNTGVIHLHGHVHLPNNLRISQGKAMDVGVDGNSLYPINMFEILELMSEQPIAKLSLPKDHHEQRLTT